jgi:hypothetical protein
MRVPCEELAIAYQVWKGSPNSIVGFVPRIHIRGSDNKLSYRCWLAVWYYGHYSIILTKAALLHHNYFDAYTVTMPKSIRDMVDRNRNCEDIAMQFLISNMTHLPPIYVKGHLDDLGVTNGISTSTNFVVAQHMDDRSVCLNELVQIYGMNPLVTSNFVVDSGLISSDMWNWF